jgi:hypothetical protein
MNLPSALSWFFVMLSPETKRPPEIFSSEWLGTRNNREYGKGCILGRSWFHAGK